MYRLGIKMVPFLVFFISLNVFVYESSHFFIKQKQYQNRIDQALKSQPAIILLGDSHLGTLNKADLMPSVANLSHGGDSAKEMYLKTKILLQSPNKISQAFICTEPQMFNSSISPNKAFMGKYLYELQEEKTYEKDRITNLLELIPLLNTTYILYFQKELFKPTKKKKGKILWKDRSTDYRVKVATNTGRGDHQGIFSIADTKKYFNATIDLLRENDIKIYSVQSPVNEFYLAECSTIDSQKVIVYVDSIGFDQNINHSNLIKDEIYFKDPDHLNKEGVKIWVKAIEEEIRVKLSHS